MIDMISSIRREYPEIFTKQGSLRKREPKKFKCSCGCKFSRMTAKGIYQGIKFASPVCPNCGEKGEENLEYNVWRRMLDGQIEQEDFILNTLMACKTIKKEDLELLLEENFDQKTQAIGTLAYFGYLKVDKNKRDTCGVIEYSINADKGLERRYELIR